MRGQRALERLLGLAPAPGRHQHVGVDRAAGAEQRRGLVAAGEVVDQLAPFAGPLPVAGAGARLDQVAVGLREGVDVAHAAGCRGRHRLLEQLHAVLVAPGVDLGATEQAEREHLEVVRAVGMGDLHRAAGVGDLLLHAGRVARALDRHPAVPGTAVDLLERTLRAGQPAAGRRGAARDEVLMGHPHRHPRGVVAAAGADVGRERSLAHRDAARNVAQEPQGLAEAVARVGGLARREHGLEGGAGGLPVRPLHRLHAGRQGRISGHRVHGPSIPARPPVRQVRRGCPPPAGTPARSARDRPRRGSTRRRTDPRPRRTRPRAPRGPRWRARRSSARSSP